MSVIAAALRELLAAGITGGQLVAAVERIEAAAKPGRSRHAEAQARYREKNKNKPSQRDHSDHQDHSGSSLDKESPQTPKETNLSSKENPPKGGQKKGSDDEPSLAHVWSADGWDRWYAAYPHKVGKGAAEAAFEKIRRSGKVPFEALVTGLEVYKRTKPAHIDWCNPATWLNQERWEDQPASPSAKPEMTEAERRRLMQKHFI